MSNGWIKLHRKLSQSQMYISLNSKQRDVLIQLLLMANHNQNEWQWGSEIHKCLPGQFITSLQSITNRCAKDVKVQSVKTSLLKLEKWCFLTNESTKTGRLITICNWETYQSYQQEDEIETNQQPTKSQPSSNQELTPNNNDKNNKNVKNEEDIKDFDSLFNYWEQNKKGGKYKKNSRARMKKNLIELTNNNLPFATKAIFHAIDNNYQGFCSGDGLYYKKGNPSIRKQPPQEDMTQKRKEWEEEPQATPEQMAELKAKAGLIAKKVK